MNHTQKYNLIKFAAEADKKDNEAKRKSDLIDSYADIQESSRLQEYAFPMFGGMVGLRAGVGANSRLSDKPWLKPLVGTGLGALSGYLLNRAGKKVDEEPLKHKQEALKDQGVEKKDVNELEELAKSKANAQVAGGVPGFFGGSVAGAASGVGLGSVFASLLNKNDENQTIDPDTALVVGGLLGGVGGGLGGSYLGARLGDSVFTDRKQKLEEKKKELSGEQVNSFGDTTPVIVDEGVQAGKPIQKITQDPSGSLVAYSDQAGSPEKAQVWSLKELKNSVA